MATQTVDFYLDPGCGWTWLTSRWLADVAEQREVEVRWRPFSLALLHADRPVAARRDTPELRARSATAARALRLLTALGERGDHGDAGRFYEEFGRRFHDGEGDGDGDATEAAAAAAGVDVVLGDGADAAVDAAIAARLDEATAAAGPDIGSPVLRFGGAAHGIHGPIISPRVTGAAAVQLFDAIDLLQAQEAFFEIKRGRTTAPALGRTS